MANFVEARTENENVTFNKYDKYDVWMTRNIITLKTFRSYTRNISALLGSSHIPGATVLDTVGKYQT